MWIYILQGVAFGMAAASQPGPFQTYLISQSLINGWRRTLPAALAPLVSDGPIIALCWLMLSQVPAGMEKALYAVSGVFILYLAFGSYKSWRDRATTVTAESTARQSVWKAALMNALSPGPYIYWTLVTGPILVSGWRASPAKGIGFLAGFYVSIVAVLAAIILGFGLASRFGPRVSRAMLGISTLALLLFGAFQIFEALAGLVACLVGSESKATLEGASNGDLQVACLARRMNKQSPWHVFEGARVYWLAGYPAGGLKFQVQQLVRKFSHRA